MKVGSGARSHQRGRGLRTLVGAGSWGHSCCKGIEDFEAAVGTDVMYDSERPLWLLPGEWRAEGRPGDPLRGAGVAWGRDDVVSEGCDVEGDGVSSGAGCERRASS